MGRWRAGDLGIDVKEPLTHAQQRPMDYTAESIIETPEGLFFSDTFLQGILDRVNALDAAGLEQESRALFQEFNLPARS